MTRILITDAVDEKYVEALRRIQGFEVDFRNGIAGEELKEIVGPYDCIIVRSRTKFNADIIGKSGAAKLIVRAGVGTDNIDIAAATRKGIVVCNTPWANVVSAAELALSMMLALSRNICDANSSMHSSRWETLKFTGAELSGKVLGIIGLGRVGREVAKRAKAFQMDVAAVDPYIPSGAAESVGARLIAMDELLRTSDIVSIHASMLPGNVHLIGRAELSSMKKGALLINTARGEMVDCEALADAIEQGLIGGAGCDVFEGEPRVSARLTALPRMLMTPHIGAQTREAQGRVGAEVVEVVESFFRLGKLMNAVNADELHRETR